MQRSATDVEARELLEFTYRLGQAYLACGEQTALVELFLRRVATARGARRTRVVAFPTAIFVTMETDGEERMTLAEGPLQNLRLDQIAEVYTLGEAAQAGSIVPAEGLARLTEILRRPARFGTAGVIVGHIVLTIGLSMVLAPSLINVLAAALLGAIVAGLKVLNRNRPLLAAPLAVVAAALVSALVYLAIALGVPLVPREALVPPLVTFLPGAMLTFGMVELAYGDMVSGSSRLITGFVQLVLLTFGLAAGALLIGGGSADLASDPVVLSVHPLWAQWAGVAVFGIGVFMHFSAPRNALPWILAVLVPTVAMQRLAVTFVGTELSGFFGTLIATPLGYFIQQFFRGPPSMVTFLPSFWILVPGSLGLLSVKTMLSDRAAGVDGLVTSVFAIASIALGTLVGASLYKALTERFGLWRLQVGRTGALFRRARDKGPAPPAAAAAAAEKDSAGGAGQVKGD
ncbi:MAG: threonine/serine exporter family protein [Phycisphaerales bacterium]|nr:threonine/serine exporter family protein [Phycisphaerales bacterium]